MKKLITGAIAAAALLFGFASCSNDLHDVENTPYTNTAGAVYILGGISSSTMESAVKSTEADFDSTKSYKVALDSEGKAKFTFTYSGNDSWSAGAGNTAFAIVADVSNGWTSANGKTRWFTSKEGIAVGNEGELKNDTATENAKITGLSAGTQYTVELALTAAGGTMKVTEGLAGVPFELIAIDDKGKLTNALSITAVNATRFSYDIAPEATAKTYKYIARYGNTYFVPSASGSFTVDGATKQEAASATAQPSSVTNPLTVTIPTAAVATKDHVSSYKLTFVLDEEIATATKLTASVEKQFVSPYDFRGINSSYGSKEISWGEPKDYGSGSNGGKPYVNKKVYTGTATFASGSNNGWGGSVFQFGVCKGVDDWSSKYTGATLKSAGELYALTNGADDNNKIEDSTITATLSKDVIITVTVTVYEGTYSSGSYSDSTEWAVSYSLK